MKIILLDGDTTETYDSLQEAVTAAMAWYSYLEKDGFKLPSWDYPIQNVCALAAAINDYKARLASALGYRDEVQAGFRLIAAETWWGDKNQ